MRRGEANRTEGVEVRTRTLRRAKLLSALTGGIALIVMGLLAVAHDQTTPGTMTASDMTLGQTTTEQSTANHLTPSTLTVTVATPALKATRPKGF